MVGQTISHYRIEAQLGSGGMGVVYRAHDERLQRKVALKLLPERMAGRSERWARVLAEARAASALNHPGITTIYEVGEEGEHLFIVMELVTGRTLRQELHGGAMETRALLRVGAQVAEALAVAHTQGIVHGDIKPENVMVQPEGRVKLLDFGIARQLAAETLTATQSAAPAWIPDSAVAGTLAYMAPEQFRGESTDARSDLFSLGVMLYELAAGRRPFPGPTATALALQIQNDTPPALAASTPQAPGELARIVHKLLHKQPAARYQSAQEVKVDLTNLARDLELGVTPAAVAGKRSVAVLPFKLLTPNPEDEYLSVALADAVINQLGASGELLVRPVNTVLRYSKQAMDPLAVARELNVQVVVDGSVQKYGQQLRVHVQAWNAGDGSTLLSAKHDSEMTALFALQDKIAEGLAKALGFKPVAEAREEPPTRNAMAYELYLRGVERLSRLNRWDTRTAVAMLEDATRLDPKFTDAWARLAEACVLMGGTLEPGPGWMGRAEKAVRRALALDPGDSESYVARARILWTPAKRFQHRAALHSLGEALRHSPGWHQALVWRGCILLHIGLLEVARESLLEALASNPDDPFTLNFLSQICVYNQQYEEGDEYNARLLALDRGNLWGNLFGPMAPLYSGRLEKAESVIRAGHQVLPDDQMLVAWEGLLWAKRGETRRAEKLLQNALRKPKSLLHTHHMMHAVAAGYAVLGNKTRAIPLLGKASEAGLPNYPLFRDDPHFQPCGQTPAFLRLMAKLKREWEGYTQEFGKR
jgi:TolB-like protein